MNLNFTTPVEIIPVHPGITYQNKILMLGSCFADEVGRYLKDYRFQAEINPFGTLYNPCSIADSVERLAGGTPFTPEEVLFSGGIYTSFSHHSSLSGSSADSFLTEANACLERNTAFSRQADTFLITLGTAYVYRHRATGRVVANCHKIKAAEFERRLLSVAECVEELQRIVETIEKMGQNRLSAQTKHRKQIIFTVSPIRHLKDGAHGNQVSKATLLLAVEALLKRESSRAEPSANLTGAPLVTGSPEEVLWADRNVSGYSGTPVHLHYFPSYEILMDELRDYRFYAADMVHPSPLAVECIFERFREAFIAKECYPLMQEAMRLTKAEKHRPLFPDTPEYARFLEKLEHDRQAFQEKSYLCHSIHKNV